MGGWGRPQHRAQARHPPHSLALAFPAHPNHRHFLTTMAQVARRLGARAATRCATQAIAGARRGAIPRPPPPPLRRRRAPRLAGCRAVAPAAGRTCGGGGGARPAPNVEWQRRRRRLAHRPGCCCCCCCCRSGCCLCRGVAAPRALQRASAAGGGRDTNHPSRPSRGSGAGVRAALLGAVFRCSAHPARDGGRRRGGGPPPAPPEGLGGGGCA